MFNMCRLPSTLYQGIHGIEFSSILSQVVLQSCLLAGISNFKSDFESLVINVCKNLAQMIAKYDGKKCWRCSDARSFFVSIQLSITISSNIAKTRINLSRKDECA